jgi:hypothetical protein
MRHLGWVWLVMVAAAGAQGPSPVQEKTARLIGCEAEVRELRRLGAATGDDRWQVLWLHQQVSERVLKASLQVDATIAQIDNEIARANELRGLLADKRDATVTRANLLSALIGGGVGGTSAGLQLSSSLSKPAAAVGIGAGAVSASLGIVGIRAQRGGTSRFDFSSNMLAKFFDRPVLGDSEYPATVWAFLGETAPTSTDGATRREQLIQTWISVKRIDSLASTLKIEHVTSEPSEGLRLTIDDLEDRAAMLQDVRARISFLKRDLANLLAGLPETGPAESTSQP